MYLVSLVEEQGLDVISPSQLGCVPIGRLEEDKNIVMDQTGRNVIKDCKSTRASY